MCDSFERVKIVLDKIFGFQFDPKFFNISPREAMTMDPQERLFLETVQHTLEDGGYYRKRVSGKAVGVFVGVFVRSGRS